MSILYTNDMKINDEKIKYNKVVIMISFLLPANIFPKEKKIGIINILINNDIIKVKINRLLLTVGTTDSDDIISKNILTTSI